MVKIITIITAVEVIVSDARRRDVTTTAVTVAMMVSAITTTPQTS